MLTRLRSPPGQATDSSPPALGKVQQAQGLVHAGLKVCGRPQTQTRRVAQGRLNPQGQVHDVILGNKADGSGRDLRRGPTIQAHRPGIRLLQSGQQPQQGRFSTTAAPQEADALTGKNRQGQALQDVLPPIALGQT